MMTSDLTCRHFTCNMAISVFICAVVLASIYSGVESATVNAVGSSGTVTLPNINLLLKCSYTLSVNETAQTLTWKKGSTTILTWTIPVTPTPGNPWERQTFSNSTTSGTVTIRLPAASVTKSSGGTYTCALKSSTGTPSASVTVTIHYKPEITLPSSVGGVEASTVTATCSVSASPAATITWKKGSSQVGTGNVLSLPNIRRSQDGAYTCNASNTVATTQKNVIVNVYYLDVPQMTLSNSTVAENDTISMICSASSKPTASITIVGPHKNKSGTNSVNYTFTAGCGDTGTYQCSAKSSKITTAKKVSKDLTVLCKPRNDSKGPEETEFVKNLTESAVFKATILALPAPVFQWTRKAYDTGEVTVINNETGHFEITNTDKNFQLNVTILTEDDYAEYSLKATNTQGETTLKYFVRSRTPPYNVETLGVANVTTDSFTVVWSSSFNGGAEQEYFIQYLPMSDSQQEAWTQKTARISDPGWKKKVYARISDIHPSRTYRVRVFSVNTFGKSEYSNVIDVTTSDLPSFGVGIVVGAVIVIVIIAAAVGGFILYRRKFKPMKKDKRITCDLENPAFSRQTSESGTGLYSGLEGERAKPPTYDALDGNQPVYQNVESKQNGKQTEPSTPEVYMNYVPDQSEPKDKFQRTPNMRKKNERIIEKKAKSEILTNAYENTLVVNDKSHALNSENKPPSDSGLYANT